jgi:hypothetical protein
MRQIPLSQNQAVLLDGEDFDHVSPFHWCYRPERGGAQGYAIRHVKSGGTYRTEYLHRAIMRPPDGHEVIVLNGDKLDCRRQNLRGVAKKEARRHHLRARNNSASGIKGIWYNPLARTWSVDIYRDRRARRVGTFLTLQDARHAHHEALLLENLELHSAPARVERRGPQGPAHPTGADQALHE